MSLKAQHSSENQDWQTPPLIVRPALKVLDGIDVDPATSSAANVLIGARQIGLKVKLAIRWSSAGGISFWTNASNRTLVMHSFYHSRSRPCKNTQVKCQLSVLDFMTCVFSRRIAFIDGRTGEKVAGMTHSTCITYLPGRTDRTEEFIKWFGPMGKLIVPFRRRRVA